MRFKSMLIAKSFLLNGYFIFGGGRNLGKLMVSFFHPHMHSFDEESNWVFAGDRKSCGS